MVCRFSKKENEVSRLMCGVAKHCVMSMALDFKKRQGTPRVSLDIRRSVKHYGYKRFTDFLLIFKVSHFIPHLLYSIPPFPTNVKHGEKFHIQKNLDLKSRFFV